jgi:hypothetical protein
MDRTLGCLSVASVAGCSATPAGPAAKASDGLVLDSDGLEVASSTCRSRPGDVRVHVMLKVDECAGSNTATTGTTRSSKPP